MINHGFYFRKYNIMFNMADRLTKSFKTTPLNNTINYNKKKKIKIII